MEPVTSSVMIAAIVAYLVKEESISTFISDFSEATVSWFRPLFLKDDGTEKEAIKKLKANPDSEARKKAVESTLEIEVEDNPNVEKYIKEIFDKINQTEEGAKTINTVINSKNVNIGNVNTGGGDFRLGDG